MGKRKKNWVWSIFIQYSKIKVADSAYQAMSNKKYKGNEINIVFFPIHVFINDIILNKEINEKGNEDKWKIFII